MDAGSISEAALGGSNYSYDSNGNLTQDDLFKYKYDAENRLVEIRNLSDTLLSSYAYDGNSMQVIKVVGSTRTWFLYAGGQLVSEFADLASATYTSGTTPGSLPSDSISILLYQHADHLTTRVTTDNAGSLSNEQAHYPYGENWYNTGTADPSVKRKFTGYRKETDSSLASGQINYAVARYFGARTGRFQMADPNQGHVGNPQRLNRYAYVLGDATNRSDPSGLDHCTMPLDVFLIYNLPWVGLGDEPPPIVNPYAFGGAPGDACSGGVYGATSVPVCISPQVPTQMFTGGGPGTPPTPVFGCALPESQERCFADLKGRSGTIPGLIGAVHVFWHVKDRTGTHFILSGEFEGGYLNAYASQGRKSLVNGDNARNFRYWPSGKSYGYCTGVDRMVDMTKRYQAHENGKTPYGAPCPTSNSIASSLAVIGGFSPSYPHNAVGWGCPVPGLDRQ